MAVVEGFDVAAYLRRIGIAEAPAVADLAALTAIHSAHALAIPFENMDIQRGRAIALDLAALQDKLVAQRRGGYCFEQNALLAAALEHLGFDHRVTRLCGRVWLGKVTEGPPPRTHMTLAVEVDGTEYLVDAGFGCHQLLAPIPIVAGATARQHSWEYELKEKDGVYTLRSRRPDGWADLYTFTREPQHPIDFEVANHYTSTHPRSRFVTALLVQRATPDERHTLRGCSHEVQRVDRFVRRTLGSAEELAAVLREVFDLPLPPDMRLPAFDGG